MTLTKDMLIQYITETFWIDPAELDPDTPLFSDGLLDSFSLVDIVAFIEEKKSINIKAADVHLENLDSVNRIMQFVERL